MNRYYDPEYDRFVDESYVLAQFEYFKNAGVCTNYTKFKEISFIPVVVFKGNLCEIVAQNPSTIWICDGERVIPLEYHHTSLCRGYVSTKSNGVVDEYSGKFGIGITVKEHNSRSSRYCYISYYIFNEEVNR